MRPSRRSDAISRIRALAPQADDNIPGQHVNSKVILRRFAAVAPHPRAGNLAIRDLAHREAKPVYRGPAGCGRIENFVRYASRSLENLWWETENDLPSAIAACSDGSVFGNDKSVKVLKDAIALHLVRSVHTRRFLDQLWQDFLPRFREDVINRYQPRLASLFTEMYHGLIPHGREGLEVVLDRLLSPMLTLREADAFHRDSLERLFRLASSHLDGLGLEVCRAGSGEFVIGDAPALAISSDGRVGLLQGVGIESATTIALPVDPQLLISTGNNNALHDIEGEQVEVLNRYQVAVAAQYVYHRPGSGDRAFALAMEPATCVSR